MSVQNTHQSSKELTEDELTCLKTKACTVSASKDECNTYNRCNWDTTKNTCNVRTPCKDLDVYDCVKSDYCDFNVDGKGTCTYIKDKIFNEDAKANRYCFKKNSEYMEDDPKGEYVEDIDYIECIKTKSSDYCKKDAINRLSCNTIKGMKYGNEICRKEQMYKMSSITKTKTNPKCMKMAQHSHNNPNEAGYIPHTPGYRTPHTFKINDDRKLRFIFNSFLVLFIILLNVGIIKLFKN
jgi:hypothetical protein